MSSSPRVVLLTGAAGGIGTCFARQLAAAGAHLALADVDAAALDALDPGDTVVSRHVVDLADRSQFPAFIAEVVAAHRHVDQVIHNAGLTVHGTFAELSAEDLDRVLDVDLRAVVHLTHQLLPILRGRPDAHVTLVSSMSGLTGYPTQVPYSTAKFGLRGFGQALRIELAAEGIGVTTVLPGAIATAFLANARSYDPDTTSQLAELQQRWGTSPERVARRALRAMSRGRAEVRVGWDSHLTAWVDALMPPLIPAALAWAWRRRLLG